MTRTEIDDLITAFSSGQPNTAEDLRTILYALSAGNATTGTLRWIDVSNAYFTANFDPSGLGINEELGWAICNGANGTRDHGGRVSISSNATYNLLGATGGETTHTLTGNEMPSHYHLNGISNDNLNLFVYGGTTSGMPGSSTAQARDEGGARTYQGNTSFTGSGQAHNNMQPYIVSLCLMKL